MSCLHALCSVPTQDMASSDSLLPWKIPAAQVLAAVPTGSMVTASLAIGFTKIRDAQSVATKPCINEYGSRPPTVVLLNV